jgi:hypothetical protein
MFAPAKPARDKVEQLARQFTAALNEPEMRAKPALVGFTPAATCHAHFGSFSLKACRPPT